MVPETADPVRPVSARIETRGEAWTSVARALGVLVVLAALAALVAGYAFWGARYGTIAGGLLVWFFVIPTWVLSRFLDPPAPVAPDARRTTWAMVLAGVLFIVAGALAVTDYASSREDAALAFVFGLIAAALVLLPIVLLLYSVGRTGAERPGLLLEATVARGVVYGIVGVLLGIAALWLLVAPLASWAEPYLMQNGRDGFTPLAGAWTWLTLPALSMGAAYPAAWAFGLVQAGFLSASYTAARQRRRESSERLRGRLDDHYALHRVGPETHQALRSRLLMERDGHIPGEAEYVAARAAVVRLLVLGSLMLVTVGLAMAGASQASEWNAEAEVGTDAQSPYWPCTDCQSEADLEAFLDQIAAWRLWSRLLWATAGLFGLYCLVSVSNLFAIMRRARRQVDAFWADRDRLEERMLEEVRTATAPSP